MAVKAEAKFERRKLGDLKNWEHNPRTILKEEYERLKAQVTELGNYKTLLVNQDNIVLGGNQRLHAFIEMFGKDHEVMCGVVTTADEAEMLKYALSDNDQAGTTDELKLAERYSITPIDLQLFHVQLGNLKPLDDVINPKVPGTLGGDASLDESELSEDLDTYLNGNIKQIVLFFDNEQYANVIERLTKLGERMSIQSHTDIFLAMLSFTEENYSEPM